MTHHHHVTDAEQPTFSVINDWAGWQQAVISSAAFKAAAMRMHDTFVTQFNTAVDFAKAGYLKPIKAIYQDLLKAYPQQEKRQLKTLSERFCLPTEVVTLHA